MLQEVLKSINFLGLLLLIFVGLLEGVLLVLGHGTALDVYVFDGGLARGE